MDVAYSREEKPIIFNTEMVKAILNGRKTQTRRPIKIELGLADTDKNDPSYLKIPDIYGDYWDAKDLCRYQPGDILWVRETWWANKKNWCDADTFLYKADFPIEGYSDVSVFKWRPPFHMPRDVARLFLEVTDVRAEQIQNITKEDIKAEGLVSNDKEVYAALWDGIYAKEGGYGYGWDTNPWVWVIEFKVDN